MDKCRNRETWEFLVSVLWFFPDFRKRGPRRKAEPPLPGTLYGAGR